MCAVVMQNDLQAAFYFFYFLEPGSSSPSKEAPEPYFSGTITARILRYSRVIGERHMRHKL